jgi:hypothetical protein
MCITLFYYIIKEGESAMRKKNRIKFTKKQYIYIGIAIAIIACASLVTYYIIKGRGYRADTISTPVKNSVNVIGADGSSVTSTESNFTILDEY